MVSLISLPKKNCFKPSSLWGHIWENVLDIFLFKDSAPTFGRFCQGFSQIGTQSWKLTRKIREARLYCAPCIASNSRRRLQWVLSESFRNKDTVYRMMMMMMMICVNFSNISDFPRPQANSHWQLPPKSCDRFIPGQSTKGWQNNFEPHQRQKRCAINASHVGGIQLPTLMS